MEEKFVTKTALAKAFSLIKEAYVAKEEGKGLSEENYTSADKAAIAGIDAKIAQAVAENEITKEAVTDALGFTPLTSEEITAEIVSQVAQLNVIKRAVVDELPTEDIDADTIYMVPRAVNDEDNVRNEYMNINGSWELIGSTEIDLSNYIKASEVEAEYLKKEDLADGIVEAMENKEVADAVVSVVPVLDVAMVEVIFNAIAKKQTLIKKNDGSLAVYNSAEEAIANAEAGETIVIHNDVEIDSNIVINDGVTIDLNGFTLSVKE